ncbi:histidinol-phosphate transaminase [Thiofilum flexile]|uniref:histidinol-phosphate transaminase n=1 Tax=Thiofilum flexile TaxID=125627 RepID=UPI000382C2F6|nr:histidinol-phosphate transaminase [Thiofilum flexile]
MSQFWSAHVHDLDPYVPGEQPKDQRYIKLNTNECPYPPSPKALQALREANLEHLRLYPDPNGDVVKDAVLEYFKEHGLTRSEVFVGNGSDEVLAHVFCGLLKHDLPLLYPDISYSFYPVYANLYQIKADVIPLRDDFTLNIDDYQRPNGGIIFPNPNAPTGIALSLASIETLLQRNPHSVVVVDEAYVDFGAESAVSLVKQYANLLVVQTLSKSRALAGLRVGFAIGQADLIEALERVKNSFNSYPLDRLALVAGAAAILDREHLHTVCEAITQTRTHTVQALEQLGFTVLPSSANFIFTRPPLGQAQDLYQQLKARGILVRYFNKPRLNEYLRITIGTEAEMNELIKQLKQLVG